MLDDEVRRYARHLVMPEVGREGQEKLKSARVLCIGAGGLGCPLLMYLAAAGVGTIGIVEGDTVDESNLQRQILYTSSDKGRPKLAVAVEKLQALNPFIHFVAYEGFLDAAMATELFPRYDIVVDGTDNFGTRYLVNDACVKFGKPNVHGSVFRFDGQVSVFDSTKGPCYRCLYPSPPDGVLNCAEAGVLGVLPGLVGSLQATEVLKLILGIGEPLIGQVLVIDALSSDMRKFKIAKVSSCAVCSRESTMIVLADPFEAACGETMRPDEVTPIQLKEELEGPNRPVLVDVREPHELEISKLDYDHHIPLGALPQRINELDPEANIVVYCLGGGRSSQATQYLRARGFKRVRNMVSGINGWADTVDPSLQKY